MSDLVEEVKKEKKKHALTTQNVAYVCMWNCRVTMYALMRMHC